MSEQAEAARPPTWRRLARLAWLLVVAAALAYVLVERWEEVQPALAALSVVQLVGAGAAALVGIAATALLWRALLAGLGSRLRPADAARVFFVGQLGKYVPGSVWPLLVQIELGRDLAVPARASAAAVALFMWVHLVTGAAVAALALPAAGVVSGWWALVAVPAAVLLLPRPLGAVLAWALRLARRQPLPALPDGSAMLAAVAAALAAWAAYGLHVLVLADGGLGLLHAVGAFAAAWCAGFVFIVAPAGAGVREAVFIALLLPALDTGAALAVVLVSRALLTVGDAAWGLVGFAQGLRRARA